MSGVGIMLPKQPLPFKMHVSFFVGCFLTLKMIAFYFVLFLKQREWIILQSQNDGGGGKGSIPFVQN